jgi:Cysteine-rich CWC
MAKKDTALQSCPVCGADNQCAMAAGDADQPCWCYSATISAEALAAIPEADVGRRCLCPACAGVSTTHNKGE